MDNYELYHYGITGQKWGVRRFQYEDGSLTPAGKERYGSNEKKYVRDSSKALKKLNKEYMEEKRIALDQNISTNSKEFKDKVKKNRDAVESIINDLKKSGYDVSINEVSELIKTSNDTNRTLGYIAKTVGWWFAPTIIAPIVGTVAGNALMNKKVMTGEEYTITKKESK